MGSFDKNGIKQGSIFVLQQNSGDFLFIMKVLGILATFLFVLVCNVTSQGDLDLRCYSCGYIVYPNGTQTKIEDDVELCGDFATDNDNIVTAGVDGCCSSFKYEIDDPESNEKITYARHGTADDEDEIWVQLPCDKETSQDEQCKNQNMTIGEDQFNAIACHCYTDLCNDHVPALNGKEKLNLNFLVMLIASFLFVIEDRWD